MKVVRVIVGLALLIGALAFFLLGCRTAPPPRASQAPIAPAAAVRARVVVPPRTNRTVKLVRFDYPKATNAFYDILESTNWGATWWVAGSNYYGTPSTNADWWRTNPAGSAIFRVRARNLGIREVVK